MYIFFICTSLRSVFLGFTSQRKNCSRVRIRQIHRTECVLDCAYISRRTGSQEDSIFYHHDCRKLVSFKALNRKKITNGYKVVAYCTRKTFLMRLCSYLQFTFGFATAEHDMPRLNGLASYGTLKNVSVSDLI